MLELLQGANLPFDALAVDGVADGLQGLQRDAIPGLQVVGEEDLSHAPLAEEFSEPVSIAQDLATREARVGGHSLTVSFKFLSWLCLRSSVSIAL